MSEENNKRKWLGILLIFAWAVILTPLALWYFNVPGNRWLELWVFYPLFIAVLAILDIFMIPNLIQEIKSYFYSFELMPMVALLCGLIAFHSGLYFAISQGAVYGLSDALMVLLVVASFIFILWLVAYIVIIMFLLVLKSLKLFIKLHKFVLFSPKSAETNKDLS